MGRDRGLGLLLGVGVGLGVELGVAVGVGVPSGVGVGLTVEVAVGVGLGVGVVLGVEVGLGVVVTLGVGVGVGVGVPPDVARYRTSANSTPLAFSVGLNPTATILPSGCKTASFAPEFKSPSEVRTLPPAPKVGSSEPFGLHRANRKSESSNSVSGKPTVMILPSG